MANEPRVYKGEQQAIGSLDLSNGPVIVQSMPGERKDDSGRGSVVPLFMLVEDIQPYTSDKLVVRYRDIRRGMVPRYVYPNVGMPVNRLTGRMAEELKIEVAEWRNSNWAVSVQWPGGTMGSDPEIFVVDKAGTVIPAFEFLGSKKTPYKAATNMANGGNSVYWDGFQAEFDTSAPTCLAYHLDSVAYGLRGVYQKAKNYNPDATLSTDSVLPVPDGSLETAKDEHVEFGCMPSINVYGMEGNQIPGRQVGLRFAGGHIHLGLNHPIGFGNSKGNYAKSLTPARIDRVVRSLDKILGVTCVALFDGYDNPVRRQYYGLPGEYRLPKHGIEYRTLSNAWLIHPVITNVVFEMARTAVAYGWQEDIAAWVSDEEEVVNTILNSDTEKARHSLEKNKAVFLKLMGRGVFLYSVDKLYDLCHKGMGEFLRHPRDIAANWGITADNAGSYTSWKQHCEGPGMNWTHTRDTLPGKI